MDHPVLVFFRIEVQGVFSPVTSCDAIGGGISDISRRHASLTEEPLQIEGFGMNVTEMKETVQDFQEYHLP